MASSIFCNSSLRTICNTRIIGKHTRHIKFIMTSGNKLAEVMETLEKNPYYNKYTEKISNLRKDSPDEFLSRWEHFQKNVKDLSQPLNGQPMSSLSKPKGEIDSSLCARSSKQKSLGDIMKMELVKDKTKEEIEKIWFEYFKRQEGIAASVTAEMFSVFKNKSRVYPTFLFPLPRDQGYEYIMCQFSGNEAHFTSLINYQAYKENAPECLTIIHFTDLADEKGIVLMRGEFDKNVLNSKEALCLANQMELYYGNNDEKRDKLLERFTNNPEDFNHLDLIAELECLSL